MGYLYMSEMTSDALLADYLCAAENVWAGTKVTVAKHLISQADGDPEASRLWTVERINHTDPSLDVADDQWINVYLLQRDSRNFGTNRVWGYKQITELSDPYYYDVPLPMLSIAQTMMSTIWREAVVLYHDRIATGFSPSSALAIAYRHHIDALRDARAAQRQ